MAREKVDNKLNVVIGTKAQVEGDTSIPENSIIVVTDGELKADEIAYDTEKNVKEAIEDLEANKVDKVDIVDNLTTNDATKVLSAKQGKVLQDTKENTANKAVDFSVVNDTKYPTAKAVKDLVDTELVGKADATHTHTKSQITDFPTTMTPTAHTHTKSQITDFPTSMPPTAHNHDSDYYKKTEIDTMIGDIDSVLDSILGV